MNSGQILVNGSSFYIGNSSNSPCQLARLDQIPAGYVHPSTKQCNYSYTHPSTIQCNVATEINNLKSSVSNGKTQIANAITGKGVTTSSSTSFATMASNINSIATIDSLPTGAGTLISEVTEYQSTFTVPSNARYGILSYLLLATMSNVS